MSWSVCIAFDWTSAHEAGFNRISPSHVWLEPNATHGTVPWLPGPSLAWLESRLKLGGADRLLRKGLACQRLRCAKWGWLDRAGKQVSMSLQRVLYVRNGQPQQAFISPGNGAGELGGVWGQLGAGRRVGGWTSHCGFLVTGNSIHLFLLGAEKPSTAYPWGVSLFWFGPFGWLLLRLRCWLRQLDILNRLIRTYLAGKYLKSNDFPAWMIGN